MARAFHGLVKVAGWPECTRAASSMRAVLSRSVGVTAVKEATMPEVIPARSDRIGVSVPVSGSLKAVRMESKVRKRMPSLKTDPCGWC